MRRPLLGACLLSALAISCAEPAGDLQDDGNGDGDGTGGSDGTGTGDGDGDSAGDGDGDGDGDDDGGGCGQDPDGIATTVDVGGEPRTFVLYLPPGYDPERAYPLIFAWHGLGGSGSLAQRYFGVEEQAGSDAIIVYPDALPRADQDGATGWELDPGGYDFAFFDAMYTHVTDRLCVDLGRVFSTGHSFGGYMSNSIGCYRGEVHNAIAPVAGGPPFYGPCDGSVATWITHGEADDVVELAQGEAARDRWIGNNACEESSSPTDPDPCVAYNGCARDLHWCLHAGGHEWPGFAAAAIWSFFSAQ